MKLKTEHESKFYKVDINENSYSIHLLHFTTSKRGNIYLNIFIKSAKYFSIYLNLLLFYMKKKRYFKIALDIGVHRLWIILQGALLE